MNTATDTPDGVVTTDKWEVGLRLPPDDFVCTRELNEQYLYGLEDYHPRYHGEGAVVHPALLLNRSNPTRSPGYRKAPGQGRVHARDDVTFHRAVPVGSHLTVTWEVTEYYERRGRTFHVLDCRILDDDDNLVVHRLQHFTFSRKTV